MKINLHAYDPVMISETKSITGILYIFIILY